MKWLADYRRRLIFVGFIAAIVLGGGIAKADFTFGTPSNLGPTVNSSRSDVFCFISVDGLEFCFDSDRPGGFGDRDLWVTTRSTVDDDWGTPLNLGPPVNSSAVDISAEISADGLELYFSSTRPGGLGLEDIWVTRRKSKDDTWDPPVNLGPPVNSSERDYGAFMSSDDLEIYFNSMRVGFHDIYVMRRATMSNDWDAPVNLGPVVNGPSHDIAPNLSADGRYLFFSDHPRYGLPAIPIRSGGFGGADIWVTSRPATSDDWGVPVNLGPTINTATDDCVPNLSPDGSTLYFASNRPGGYGGLDGDIWQAPILPVVDFNGDGIIDAADMCIMVDHWGENYRLCDIGPTPLGDGVIDVHDLVVLAEHLFEEVKDPTLIAHWPLDEAQGAIAYDSAADFDGTLIGDPMWQPDGGKVAGALQFDGVDDYVNTDFVLNPEDGKFSVLAWIKGGAPGQVVLSQADAENWLCTDSVEGCLMTELKAYGRGAAGPPLSQPVITDGEWHRIALVWDDSYRRLYVDGAEVATDTAPLSALEDAYGGLYFGVGSALTPGTFFSGLIDDVRIYNRAVSP
ncbi:MAG: LamG-like jellyroll fold domain-containing protein [Planctomycetota bacterium]|jgi:Tol biopolymer transport system component